MGKKKIIAIVLAVLIAGGLGGFAYANDIQHEPMMGQKLVGYGAFAEWDDDEINNLVNTSIILTNPDCVSAITVDRISVFAYDGRCVYEGDFLKWREEIPWEDSMAPHETRMSELGQYVSEFVKDYPDDSEVWMNFTVEVFWSGAKNGLPLSGYVSTFWVKRDTSGNMVDLEYAGAAQMMNMNQLPTPVREEKPN